MKAKLDLLPFLKTHFGFDSFRPNQEEIITEILAGNNVLAVMPTGGGKSLCFQLPALILPGTALVISPLIALMKDQVDALRTNGIAAAYYNSSMEFNARNQTMELLKQGKLKLLYVAPESLGRLLPTLSNIAINLIAVDEAHCISAWGHDFRPVYTRLGIIKDKFPTTPLLALTATADLATRDDICKQLKIPDAQVHIASFDRKNLFLEVRPGNNRLKVILKFLEDREEESGIIYCLSRRSTEKVAEALEKKGFRAKAYHAGMTAEERSKIQEEFIYDRSQIIVATIAFGMGIDKSNVRWVIHYNLPKNIDSYYQEIGRSGRDGLPAHTLLFYSYADVKQLREFIEESPTSQFQLAKLERMQQFAEALSCRRVALLNYFGEHRVEHCGNCDNCTAPPKYFDGTLLAQKICSAVARLGEKEAPGMVVDVLRGSQNAAIYNKGYQKIKTYGTIRDISWRDLHQYLIQLINQGVLEIRFHQGGKLLLTPLAHAILYQGKTIQLANLPQDKKDSKKAAPAKNQRGLLFGELRKLRSTIAAEEKVPAFMVFSDASLQDMEEKLPESPAEFLEINGVGQVKLEKYSVRFLDAIEIFQKSKKNGQPSKSYSEIAING